ncbi:transmembrane emp24 domain containing protein 2 precursor, putative [Entamoeba invadens IP1]|uniref:Transmembrane emp24 domain containing protein 2, putative n=1 Tax=Entamoeba invadens IP1 TaxID=370355 RepID=A0A0A1U0T9_ENTIV|nr:transmembrane emp24 domain containing protein 2 precursor, putative [Entamoeba invadens IP1]ELP86143.1 transmembrane emp24 domain containing protein 2 precursor, putative [Entamoeba invadens IP1]|eukprot:XP_004185489.1 transmembrane emp24 domain containing protein 2 precursor, putative [Entamoeba invadens IP1]
MLSVLLLISAVSGFTTEIAGGKEECFMEKLDKGAHIAIYYQVVEGGNNDIDFNMYNPNGEIFVGEKQQSSGMIDKEAPVGGVYKVCLSNKFSSFGSARTVALFMDFSSHDTLANDEQADKVEKLSTELTHLLTHARIEVVMLQLKNQMHQDMLQEAYSWSTYLFIFQGILILAMSLVQTYLIKKYFGVKRTI